MITGFQPRSPHLLNAHNVYYVKYDTSFKITLLRILFIALLRGYLWQSLAKHVSQPRNNNDTYLAIATDVDEVQRGIRNEKFAYTGMWNLANGGWLHQHR